MANMPELSVWLSWFKDPMEDFSNIFGGIGRGAADLYGWGAEQPASNIGTWAGMVHQQLSMRGKLTDEGNRAMQKAAVEGYFTSQAVNMAQARINEPYAVNPVKTLVKPLAENKVVVEGVDQVTGEIRPVMVRTDESGRILSDIPVGEGPGLAGYRPMNTAAAAAGYGTQEYDAQPSRRYSYGGFFGDSHKIQFMQLAQTSDERSIMEVMAATVQSYVQKGLFGGWGGTLKYLMSDVGATEVAYAASKVLGLPVDAAKVKNIVNKLMATSASGLVFAFSKNFPLAAAAYFGLDRALSPAGQREVFNGYQTGTVTLDGVPVVPIDIQVPEGLPNEIFADYRFTCYDRLTGKWFPTDEIKPLDSVGGEEYRWLCLDRVSGRIYHANLIKKPRIYLD